MRTCPACKSRVKGEAEYCPLCGEYLHQEEPENNKIILYACVGIAVMGLIMYLLFGIKGSIQDMGHQDGYEHVEPGFMHKISAKYRQGYEEGKEHAYWFNKGCTDKYHRRGAQHTQIEEYMEGYNNC